MPDVAPDSLTINAWTGEETPAARVLPDAPGRWSVTRAFPPCSVPLAAPSFDLSDWRHPKVGWGVVLPDDETLPQAARATAVDAPDPIRTLVARRPNAVVLRYRQDLAMEGQLRRYDERGGYENLAITGSPRGSAPGCIPRYLLLYGGPRVIPWEFQYRLGLDFFVGRLDLDGAALERYVDALLAAWSASTCRRDAPLVWSTDHATDDITHLMRIAIADPLHERFASDDETRAGLRVFHGDDATAANLVAQLGANQPALVVTTSHGLTGPLSDPARMKARLGWLVAQDHVALDPASILAGWEPDGAVWYAHACCSAGGDDRTFFADLLPAGSKVARVLEGVASLGATVAGLPRALLGATKPLRAFIGHVEPTFDWTLQARTRQLLTDALLGALYDRMYLADPVPVGLAFHECHRLAGSLFAQWAEQVRAIERCATPASRRAAELVAMRTKLTALDRRAMVILGDPTVALPRLAGQRS